MNKWKLRDTNGYLINRCNRCGEKLFDKNRGFAGNEPICLICLNKLKPDQSYYQAKRQTKFRAIKFHRKDYYLKALDQLFNGNCTPEYTKERWIKFKNIKDK